MPAPLPALPWSTPRSRGSGSPAESEIWRVRAGTRTSSAVPMGWRPRRHGRPGAAVLDLGDRKGDTGGAAEGGRVASGIPVARPPARAAASRSTIKQHGPDQHVYRWGWWGSNPRPRDY